MQSCRHAAQDGVRVRVTDACFHAPAAIKAVCAEYRCHNADINMREDCDLDDLVDVIEGSRSAPRQLFHAERSA